LSVVWLKDPIWGKYQVSWGKMPMGPDRTN
jgi:hypothetical protein